jgi:hypothetical protein
MKSLALSRERSLFLSVVRRVSKHILSPQQLLFLFRLFCFHSGLRSPSVLNRVEVDVFAGPKSIALVVNVYHFQQGGFSSSSSGVILPFGSFWGVFDDPLPPL